MSTSSKTRVYFDIIEDEEIYYYIDNYKNYDKAGAYGIKEWIGYVGIKKIKGYFFNVMGLNVHKLYKYDGGSGLSRFPVPVRE